MLLGNDHGARPRGVPARDLERRFGRDSPVLQEQSRSGWRDFRINPDVAVFRHHLDATAVHNDELDLHDLLRSRCGAIPRGIGPRGF